MTFAKELKGKITTTSTTRRVYSFLDSPPETHGPLELDVMTRSDIADDAYVDVERHMAAALARD